MQAIHQHLEAKQVCDREVPERRRVAGQLREALVQSRQGRQRLEEEFAAESWNDVAGHIDQCCAALQSADSLQRQAEENTDLSRQRYLSAAGILRQVEKQQQLADNLLAQLRKRLAELLDLRERSQQQRQDMARRADEAQQWIAQHDPFVGAHARELWAVAQDLRDRAESGMREARVDAERRAEHRRRTQEMEHRRRTATPTISIPSILAGGLAGSHTSHGSSHPSSSSSRSWSSGSSQRSW